MKDFDSELFDKAVVKGGEILESGVTDFAQWSGAMLNHFGEPIRTHLDGIWWEASQLKWQKLAPGSSPPPGDNEPFQKLGPQIPSLQENTLDKQMIMNKETVYRAAILALLAATLIVQILILVRIPPKTLTWGDLTEQHGAERRTLMSQLPVVRVEGEVGVEVQNTSLDVDVQSVSPTVDVDVQSVSPTVDVEVHNVSPLEVQIVR
jgi:hypothetical protein